MNTKEGSNTKTSTIGAGRSLRALRLVEMLSRASLPMTLSQLAHRLDLPKSSVMRLLGELEAMSYVVRTPGSRAYVTGPRAHALGLSVVQGPALLRACQSVLERLVALIGETCNLNMLSGDAVQYLARVESPGHLRLQLRMDIGSRVPLHCTASGKLFLAFTPQPRYGQLLSRLVLERMGPKTIISHAALESALHWVRSREIGIDDEEFVVGMVAVAVPVRNPQGDVIAALACHAPTAQASLENLISHVGPMRIAADQIARILSAGCDKSIH
ncbi:MAG: IclR family transcriptional regulator [Castellaniella sp.]